MFKSIFYVELKMGLLQLKFVGEMSTRMWVKNAVILQGHFTGKIIMFLHIFRGL